MKNNQNNFSKIKVAAIQLTTKVSSIEANNQHATPFIEKAAKQGAKLVVLPELYSSGYLATAEIWESAETCEGPTSKWLKELSKRLGIYLGTGFVETDGEDFYNSYMISDPYGEIIGVNRKKNAEGYAFKRGNSSHVFETEIGKIGVGICADNQYAFLQKLMYEQSIDIMLMPHAAPLRKKIVSEKINTSEYEEIEAQYIRIKNLPKIYANMFGVPVIFATQIGSLEKLPGLIGKIMDPEKWHLAGVSRIIDSDGTLKAELGDIEDFAIAEVILDKTRKDHAIEHYNELKCFNGFNAFTRKVIFPIAQMFGRMSYNKSKRKLKTMNNTKCH